ncbi:3,9-dihydroxypterocarpan 6A-monooxygenase [Heracleum sosnowskyi]|uniref:3,9-dihydroxypterocarpan 6A-monooxygenase n=1 Tax=Heracleum sosnowskyi TaxID=360622 RepID=A0AAD8N178_9APIA|nr:3,9-dihydroxypterocarpan 6A-monooxygenase [Heracleum sosnowskyi]
MANFQDSVVTFFIWLMPSIIILRAILKSRTRSRLPPGPFRLPIIGHLHLLPPIPHQALHKLSKRYGPLMHIFLGSNPCVVVSSPEMAKEFLKIHEASWSDRGETVASEYMSYHSQDFTYAPYGPYWKFGKKLFASELLGGQALDHLYSVRRFEIESMVNLLLQKARGVEAVDVGSVLARLTNNVISSMVMRKRCSEKDDDAGEVRTMIKEISDVLGAFNLSDYIWFCKNLDLQGIKKKLVDVRGRYDRLLERIIEEHRQIRRKRQENDNGSHPQKDFLDLLLDMSEDDSMEFKLNMDKIKAIVLDTFTAGTEPVANVIEWALAELINHPIIMEKARQEIETVVGKSRLVEESDIVNLPYLQAIVKESLRLHPGGALIPRQSTEDCTIGNYYIPAKTRLFVNVWAIGRDENHWESPLEFKPERFLATGSGQLDVRGQHFQLLPFGAGRRQCPSTALSVKVVQSTIAAMIQCFDWNVVGGEGNNGTTLNMDEGKAFTISRVHPLICVPVARLNPFPSI